jgi:hypothetical protein
MVVIQVIPDRFKNPQERVLAGLTPSSTGQQGGEAHVRRPTRGIQLKEDTYATLRLVAGNGGSINLIDAGSRRKDATTQEFLTTAEGERGTDIYSNFLLQSIHMERMEKHQILETFGEPYIFFFGERAEVHTFQGVLLNTADFNWEAEWFENYRRYLRGTKCVENDARIFLSFDDTLVSGLILGCVTGKSSQEQNVVTLQFQMFITSETNIIKVGSPYALPPGADVQLPEEFDMSPFRPTLLEPNEVMTGAVVQQANGQQTVAPRSLAEGLQEVGLGTIVRAWNRTQQLVNTVARNTSNMLNGEVLRLPVGFAGALAFDEDPSQTFRASLGKQGIQYGTFDLNMDEYVGRSSHYGSSVGSNGVNRVRVEAGAREKLRYNQRLVNELEQRWRTEGFNPPQNQAGPIARFLQEKNVGMLPVGSAEDWKLPGPDGLVSTNVGSALPGTSGRFGIPGMEGV